MKRLLIIFLFLGSIYPNVIVGQQRVVISGKAVDPQVHVPVANLIVVSRKSGIGQFGEIDGSFEITLSSDDTLLVSVPGYRIERIPVPDGNDSIYMQVNLVKLQKDLPELVVRTEREVKEVKRDLETIRDLPGYELSSAADLLGSPITALYERFSRLEKSKREVARLEREDERLALLKELMTIYVDNRVIELKEEEFEGFIRYLNLPDEYIRSASVYDLTIAVKSRFRRWEQVSGAFRDH